MFNNSQNANIPPNNQNSLAIKDIYSRLENLIQIVDVNKNFYNNIFFPEKDKEVPMNLYNFKYNQNLEENELTNEYKIDQPVKTFCLPSSDESGNEKNYSKIPTFKHICDDIIDFETLTLINEENELPNGIYPILMFRSKEQINTKEKILDFIQRYSKKNPFEIQILTNLNNNNNLKNEENSSSVIFIIKFYSLDDSKIISQKLFEQFQIGAKLCYDSRDILDSKWYCVIFRRECHKDQQSNKFNELIGQIFKEINCDKKKIISFSLEAVNAGKIDKNFCVKKFGNVFYSAIKVESLEQAINLCIQYNTYKELKVHLHYLSYRLKKNKMPHILVDKEQKNKKFGLDKIRKSYKEDEEEFIANKLFNKSRLLNKKKKKNK